MSICNNCGAQNQDNASFCVNCGSALAPTQSFDYSNGLYQQSSGCYTANNQQYNNQQYNNQQCTNQGYNNQNYGYQSQQANNAWNYGNQQPNGYQCTNYPQNQNYNNSARAEEANSAANLTLLFGILSFILGGILWFVLTIVYYNKAKRMNYDGVKPVVGLVIAIFGMVAWVAIFTVIFFVCLMVPMY